MSKKDKSGISRDNASDILGYDNFLVQQVVGQIPWGYNVRILGAVKDPVERLWYAQQTIEVKPKSEPLKKCLNLLLTLMQSSILLLKKLKN